MATRKAEKPTLNGKSRGKRTSVRVTSMRAYRAIKNIKYTPRIKRVVKKEPPHNIPDLKALTIDMTEKELSDAEIILKYQLSDIDREIEKMLENRQSFSMGRKSDSKLMGINDYRKLCIGTRLKIVQTVICGKSLDDLDDTFPPRDSSEDSEKKEGI